MKKISRKQQLRKRAHSFAAQTDYVQDAASPVAAASLAWEDGYRAAMRDARKIIRECYADSAPHTDPEKRIKMRNHCVRVRLERFLSPLR